MIAAFRGRAAVWGGRILMAAVLIAVGLVVYRNLDAIARRDFDFKVVPMLAGVGVVALAFWAQFLVWTLVTASFGVRPPLLQSAYVWFASHLGRYVPGKAAVLLVRLNLYRGESKRKVAVASGIEQIGAVAAACLLVLLAVAIYPRDLPVEVRYYAGAGALLFLTALWPPVLLRAVNFGFRLIRKDPMDSLPSYRRILLFVFLYLGASLIHGLGFFMVLRSLTDIGFEFFLPVAAVYYSAGIIGLLALFAPSGLGVREGVLMTLLPAFVPMPAVILAALSIRVITTGVEIILAGIFLLFGKIMFKG